MSTAAVRWALYDAGADNAEDLVVLVALADHASGSGEVTITTAALARKLGMRTRDVADSLCSLRRHGLIHTDSRGAVLGLAAMGGRAPERCPLPPARRRESK